jgi:hypothetical protein
MEQAFAIERTSGACAGVPLLTLLRHVRRISAWRPVAINVKGGNLG